MKKPDSSSNRFGKFNLWQWGLILIGAGVFAGFAAKELMAVLVPPGSAIAAQGQAFGRGLATLLSVVAGVVCIILHFVRRNRH